MNTWKRLLPLLVLVLAVCLIGCKSSSNSRRDNDQNADQTDPRTDPARSNGGGGGGSGGGGANSGGGGTGHDGTVPRSDPAGHGYFPNKSAWDLAEKALGKNTFRKDNSQCHASHRGEKPTFGASVDAAVEALLDGLADQWGNADIQNHRPLLSVVLRDLIRKSRGRVRWKLDDKKRLRVETILVLDTPIPSASNVREKIERLTGPIIAVAVIEDRETRPPKIVEKTKIVVKEVETVVNLDEFMIGIVDTSPRALGAAHFMGAIEKALAGSSRGIEIEGDLRLRERLCAIVGQKVPLRTQVTDLVVLIGGAEGQAKLVNVTVEKSGTMITFGRNDIGAPDFLVGVGSKYTIAEDAFEKRAADAGMLIADGDEIGITLRLDIQGTPREVPVKVRWNRSDEQHTGRAVGAVRATVHLEGQPDPNFAYVYRIKGFRGRIEEALKELKSEVDKAGPGGVLHSSYRILISRFGK